MDTRGGRQGQDKNNHNSRKIREWLVLAHRAVAAWSVPDGVPSASGVWCVMNVRVVSVGERAPGGSIQATTHPE